MRTLLVGRPGKNRRALGEALRAQEHEVHAAEDAEAAWSVYDEKRPALVVLAHLGEEDLVLCRHIRSTDGGEAPILMAAPAPAAPPSLDELVEAGIDELIFTCDHPERLRVQLALASRRIRRRARRTRAEQALRESEAKARAVLETTVNGIITIDAHGIIESFNQAAEAIFGHKEKEVVGENISVLMPEPYRSEHDSYLTSYRETGRRKIIGIGREVEGRRRDGSVFPMDLAVSEVQLNGRRIFTGIVRDISERRRLEREVLEVSEEERRRIGQDLHDNLGQQLTGIGLLSRGLAHRLAAREASEAEDAAEIERLVKEADEQARGLARGLVPVDLEAKGLADALRRLAGQAEHLYDVRCSFREVGAAAVYDNTAATHLYRIAQEAVTNAARHGKASHIAVMLASGKERLRLRIKDDGVGFPEEETITHESQVGGMGVRTMHHRARMIGATLDIQSTPGEGTTVTCTMRPDRTGAPRPQGGSTLRGGSVPGARPQAPGCPVH